MSAVEYNSIWAPCSGLQTSIHIYIRISNTRPTVAAAAMILCPTSRRLSTRSAHTRTLSFYITHRKVEHGNSALPRSHGMGQPLPIQDLEIGRVPQLTPTRKQWNCKRLTVLLHACALLCIAYYNKTWHVLSSSLTICDALFCSWQWMCLLQTPELHLGYHMYTYTHTLCICRYTCIYI
jgi:hypothetical protein